MLGYKMDFDLKEVIQPQNISYLRARDPSILACGYLAGSNIQFDVDETLFQSTAIAPKEEPTDDDHLQVYLRLKKSVNFIALYEICDDKTLLCKVPEGAQCIRNVRGGTAVRKIFKFSKIFGPDSQQIDLFNNVIKQKVLLFINGFNCSLLTYGASGSGKTYTIVGTANEPGIIPRALEYLFRTLPQLPEEPQIKPSASGGITWLSHSQMRVEKFAGENLLNGSLINVDQHTRTYRAMQEQLSNEPVAVISDDINEVSLSVWVSFAEIYNESVHDLLLPEPLRGRPRTKLRLGHTNGHAYIKDITTINVTSGLQAYHILHYGLHNLQYAATSINDHSSRSHSIFTIKLAQASSTKEGISVSAFNFCDLAGSERLKKTHNIGDRLKESNNINTSLLVLGRCISLVREAQKRSNNQIIPFRESKLTQLFQRALLGHEAISMIVNVNSTRDMFDESQHVLNFSAIAKDIAVEQQQMIKRQNNRFSQYMDRASSCSDIAEEFEGPQIKELEDQIAYLVGELQQQKLDAKEDREYVINKYKQLLKNTTQYWEDRCKTTENELARAVPVNLEPENTRKRKLSVIVLDSSSDSDEDEDVTQIKLSKKCCNNEDLVTAQNELAQMRMQLQTTNNDIQKLAEERKLLQETLEDAKTAYVDLEEQYKTTLMELNRELIDKQDQISNLTSYYEVLEMGLKSETEDECTYNSQFINVKNEF